MNLLVEDLPEAIEIDGREYPIRTDFRSCLKIILAFEDDELTPQEKAGILLSILYPTCPANVPAALEQAHLFLNGGEAREAEGEPGPRLYSFSKDANFIFAAFQQTHGIDLQKAQLHWWHFMALFMDLGADTTWSNLVGLRKRIKNGTATKEERAAAREMGDLIEVPEVDTRTLDEKEMEAAFMRKLQERNKK